MYLERKVAAGRFRKCSRYEINVDVCALALAGICSKFRMGAALRKVRCSSSFPRLFLSLVPFFLSAHFYNTHQFFLLY
jgi:hypothetical protein